MRVAFDVVPCLGRLTDPYLFELLLRYCKGSGISDPLPELEEIFPDVSGADAWAERVEPGIVEAMVRAMPKGIPEPEALARSAIGVFRDDLANTAVAMAIILTPKITDPDGTMKPVYKAAVRLRQTVAALGTDAAELLDTWFLHDVGPLKNFLEGLDKLIEISDYIASPWDGEKKQGPQYPEPISLALIATGHYLTQQGLARKRAAHVLTALLQAHPDLPAKSLEATYKLLRDSDPPRPRRGEGKTWVANISLTPSAR
jgi:hypothetical protein